MKTSLAVRIGLAVTVAFLAISVLAFGFMFRRSDLSAEIALPGPNKVAAMADLLDGFPRQTRGEVIPALSSPLLEISIIQGSALLDAHSKSRRHARARRRFAHATAPRCRSGS